MNLVAVDYQADNAAELFAKSLHETGFGVLKNHPIQKQLVEDIYTTWQAFFDSEEKFDYTYNKGTQDGYFSKSVSEVAKGFKKKDINAIIDQTVEKCMAINKCHVHILGGKRRNSMESKDS